MMIDAITKIPKQRKTNKSITTIPAIPFIFLKMSFVSTFGQVLLRLRQLPSELQHSVQFGHVTAAGECNILPQSVTNLSIF